jgi:hypothetical protein
MAAPTIPLTPNPAMLLPRIPLRQLCETGRFWYLDRLEQYFYGTQDDAKRYDWNGNMRTMGMDTAFQALHQAPGYYVALDRRRPSTRKRFGLMIVSSLTQMSVDGDAFPEINVDQDEAAQQALREWSKIMTLPQKLAEARDKGGAEGTACMSLGVLDGQFAVDVHNAKHCQVLSWANRQRYIPERVLKAYCFQRDVFVDGARVAKHFWYVRYWDTAIDVTWEAIPAEVAERPDWSMLMPPSFVGQHSFGFCPFYWVQNLPDSEEEDGQGDYEGLEDKFDQYNRLLSATTKGTTENVDPTLVVKDEDDGQQVTKGSGAVIHSPQGAEFLELAGTSSAAALTLLTELRVSILEECQVVIPRDDTVAGNAQSAAAMRLRYRTMISRCNKIRAQYGGALQRILQDLLRVARKYRDEVRDVYDAQGRVTGREQYTLTPALDPGEAELVTLKWPEYFHPTSQDLKDVIATAQTASGGQPVISHKTSVEFAAPYFGVADTDAELKEIESDKDADMERTKEALQTEVDVVGGGKGDEE